MLIDYFPYFTFLKQPSRGFLRKSVLRICSKFAEEHPCRSVISVNLQSNFIEITLWHGFSPVNLLHIFRTPFSKNTSGGLLLVFKYFYLISNIIICSLVTFTRIQIFLHSLTNFYLTTNDKNNDRWSVKAGEKLKKWWERF